MTTCTKCGEAIGENDGGYIHRQTVNGIMSSAAIHLE
jgi:hypothetical protein